MGAVVDGGAPIMVRNEDVIGLAGVDEAEFKGICDSELAEIERRRQRYLGSRRRVEVRSTDEGQRGSSGARSAATPRFSLLCCH
jgi:predicted phosphoribosyltransferase